MAGVFLSAEWRQLAMLNYRVPRELLAGHVPRGTELDLWQGSPYVSVVGFMFLDTRIMGVPVPFHGSFEEVNLRTYVRRAFGGAVRHAVTFIRELVPRRAVATAARLSYNEPYTTLPMAHRIGDESVQYSWHTSAGWSRLEVSELGPGAPAAPGSEEEFITTRHWGYTRQRDGSTVEYEVRHPPWNVRRARAMVLAGDLAGTYGAAFAAVLGETPSSAFLADGSAVTVHSPRRIAD
jgi:uncharacterized protein YqjF (DUF2071 family)